MEVGAILFGCRNRGVPASSGSAIVLSYLILAVLLASAGSASANPGAFDPWAGIGFFLLFGILIAINYPVNLLLFSSPLLTTSLLYGKRVGTLSQKFGIHLSKMLLIVLLVTIIGALIDIVLVVPQHDYNYGPFDASIWRLTLATIIIFGSILFPSFLLGLRFRFVLIVAGFMAIMNPVIWSLIRDAIGGDVNSISVLKFWLVFAFAALVADLVIIFIMRRWHLDVYLCKSVQPGA